jgi:hypothetical protein
VGWGGVGQSRQDQQGGRGWVSCIQDVVGHPKQGLHMLLLLLVCCSMVEAAPCAPLTCMAVGVTQVVTLHGALHTPCTLRGGAGTAGGKPPAAAAAAAAAA